MSANREKLSANMASIWNCKLRHSGVSAGLDWNVVIILIKEIRRPHVKVTPGYKLTPPGLRNDLKRKKISPNGSKAKQSNTILNYFSRN